jgi:hypothetical protein
VSRPLVRIFRLRALLEEVSRAELERLAQQASQVERALARERGLTLASRREAFSLIPGVKSYQTGSVADTGPADQAVKEKWIVAEAAGDMAQYRERQLEPLAHAAARRVEAGREEFFARRKERQQVETVLQNEAALRRINQEHRDQRALDDWFAMMQIRRSRHGH